MANATLIDGSAVAREILARVGERTMKFESWTGKKPCLAAVLVGDDPASVTYVKMKANRSRKLGLDSRVTFCHSRTADLASAIAMADIVVAAVGKPELVRGTWLKPGAVVLDAGYNPGNVGDVAFAEAARQASLITPVPGGVGPMTIAVLLEQTVDAAYAQAGLQL